ncbi:MAG: hypothetical protein K6L75_02085 [Cellvibrionaceae bacterium]
MKKSLFISLVGEFLSKFPLFGFEFLLAAKLSLYDYAFWSSLLLLYRFSPYLHFGVLSYFNKRYPLMLGRNRQESKKRIARQVNKSINLIALLIFILAILFLFLDIINFKHFIVIVTISFIQIYTYSQAVLRNEGEFLHFTIGLLLFSGFQFIFSLVMVDEIGIWGAILSVFFGYLVSILYYVKISNVDFNWGMIRLNDLIRITKLGLVPFLLTISAFFVQVSDRIALFIVDDTTLMASYGFFAIFLQLGIVMVNSIGKVMSPYIITKVGRDGASSTLSLCIYNVYIICFVYLIFFMGCYLYGDFFVNKFFQNFSGSILGVLNYGTVGFLLAIGLTFYPQLIAVNKEKTVIYLNFISSAFLVVAVYFGATLFKGYLVFSSLSLLINSCVVYLLVLLLEKKLEVNLKSVKLIVAVIFVNTFFVGQYVWN